MVICNVSSHLYDNFAKNAYIIISICNKSNSIVTIEKAGTKIGVTDISDLLHMSNCGKTSLTIKIDGEDEHSVIDGIYKLLM